MVDAKIIGFYDEFTGLTGGGVPFLMGNVGDIITSYVQLDIHWESYCDYVISGTDSITRSDGGSFIADGFRLGDNFETIGAGANDGTTFTISSITDKVIKATGLTNGTFTTAELHGTTLIDSMEYLYNISPSTNNFLSMTDVGNKQKYVVSGLDCTDTSTLFDFIPAGPSKAWAVHLVGQKPQIVGNGYSNFVQSFIISHQTLIVPLSLVQQDLNFKNKINPDYFKSDACLTWAGNYTAKTYLADPCSPHTSGNIFCNGNTGWYNENFNGLPSNYNIKSIEYDNGNLKTIDPCINTPIKINIGSPGGLFQAGMTMFVWFHWFAEPESSYQQTSTEYLENFHYDYAKLVEGAPAVDGAYAATDNQAIKAAQLVVVDPSTAEITFDAAFTTTFFQTPKKYIIGVSVQDPAFIKTKESDRVSLLADYNTTYCNKKALDYTDLMQDVSFFQHPKSASAGKTDINGIVGDIWLAKAFIGVKKSASVILQAMDVAIEAVNSVTGARFDLERKSYSFAQFIPDANYIQDINITEPRNWQTWTEYDYITFKHCPSMDDANYAVYELNYPVRLMDETYRKLAAGGAYFQNPTNNWSQYSQNGDWDVKFNIYVQVAGQEVQVNLFEQNMTIRNYDVKGNDIQYDFNIISIDTIKAGTGINLNGVISNTAITKIQVNIAGDFFNFPTSFDGFYAVLGFCSVQTGSCDFASTNLPVNKDSVWLGIDPQNNPYVKFTITSKNTAILECLLDGTKFDKDVDLSTYYITAKIGFQDEQQLLAQENQAFILQENGFGILI